MLFVIAPSVWALIIWLRTIFADHAPNYATSPEESLSKYSSCSDMYLF
jgi:hypothetical protein